MVGGIVLPLAMLPVVWAITIGTMAAEATPDGAVVATIEVTGHQWSYEVRCEGAQDSVLDEIHIPVGQPVLLRVTSADVVHSLWIPRLAGKQDMIPGETHELWLEATEPGVYVGQCAEFCGEHHADHTLTVFAGDAGACGAGGAGASLVGLRSRRVSVIPAPRGSPAGRRGPRPPARRTASARPA